MSSINNHKSISVINKLMVFDCPDLDSPYESRDMRCCQYCLHIKDDQVKLLVPEKWVCDLPNREAQRRHWANLDNKQKVLQ